jgi:hypothetical protein
MMWYWALPKCTGISSVKQTNRLTNTKSTQKLLFVIRDVGYYILLMRVIGDGTNMGKLEILTTVGDARI